MTRQSYAAMSNDDLVSRYIDAGIRQHEASKLYYDGGIDDYVKAWSAVSDEIIGIHKELRSRGSLSLLLPLLDHESPGVRLAVATQCLPLAPERAIAVLEAIVKMRNHVEQMEAGSALYCWRTPVLRNGVPAWAEPSSSAT
jgi:hypothetical protein